MYKKQDPDNVKSVIESETQKGSNKKTIWNNIMIVILLCVILYLVKGRESVIVINGKEDLSRNSFRGSRGDPELNERPVIGVLSQEIDASILNDIPPELQKTSTSYIAASYVKWIEAGGARAVPVVIGK